MNIILGKTAGFCFGVKRAIDKAYEQTIESSSKSIYCLGELVHNKTVMDKIKKSKIEVIDNVDNIQNKDAILIIRAHGISPATYEQIKSKDIEIIDCTCPFVKRIHDIVQTHSKNGDYVFIIGNKNHPEIVGTYGYCNSNCSVINGKDDIKSAIEELQKTNCKNLLIVAQTTFDVSLFEEISTIIKNVVGSCINVNVENTICNATMERQKETDEISKKVEYMIIIGGKNSSNTKKLYDIASKNTNSILIETSNDLDLKILKQYDTIGIMAGASTPQETIDDVLNVVSR